METRPVKLRQCFGCGASCFADDDYPDEARCYCVDCVMGDVPDLLAEGNDDE
jgi:hypothetical protein